MTVVPPCRSTRGRPRADALLVVYRSVTAQSSQSVTSSWTQRFPTESMPHCLVLSSKCRQLYCKLLNGNTGAIFQKMLKCWYSNIFMHYKSLFSQRRSVCSPETGQVSEDRGQRRSQTDEHINHTRTVSINLASVMTAAAASQAACSRAAWRCVSAHRPQILNIMAAVSQPMVSSISLLCLAQKKSVCGE